MPETAALDEDDRISSLIAAFEPVACEAGDTASNWLREHALPSHPSTVTWIWLRDKSVTGFYAVASASVELSQSARLKRLRPRKDKPDNPTQPATLIAWLAKRNDSGRDAGEKILLHAFSTATSVAVRQGNLAVVLDAFDTETAQLWNRKYGFVRASGKPKSRLWVPLNPKE